MISTYNQVVDPTRIALQSKIKDKENIIEQFQIEIEVLKKALLLFPDPNLISTSTYTWSTDVRGTGAGIMNYTVGAQN